MLASVVLAMALFSTAYSQVVHSHHYMVPALSRTEVRDNHNQFSLTYQTGDGQAVSGHGALKVLPNGEQVLVQQGTYAYTSPDGTPVSVAYIADENGFQIVPTHTPRGPAANAL